MTHITHASEQTINYGEHLVSNEGFNVDLKVVKEDPKKKFVILGIVTRFGKAEFIFLPEEAKVLSEMLNNSIEGVELDEECMPSAKTIMDKRKEMFPDIRGETQ